MSFSLARGKPFDVGLIGRDRADLPALGDDPASSRFDFRQWWPNDRRALPFELEIGSGKGTFLVQQASQQPDVNYLGIEYARQFWACASDRLRRHHLAQVRLLHDDAAVFVGWYCPDALFRQVHIYFPDPWPKKRHHKRRLIQTPFLRQLHRVLTPTGLVRIVTDHDDYFDWMHQHLAVVADLFTMEPFESPAGADEGEMVGTNFERKYRRQGRPFHAMTLRKKSP